MFRPNGCTQKNSCRLSDGNRSRGFTSIGGGNGNGIDPCLQTGCGVCGLDRHRVPGVLVRKCSTAYIHGCGSIAASIAFIIHMPGHQHRAADTVYRNRSGFCTSFCILNHDDVNALKNIIGISAVLCRSGVPGIGVGAGSSTHCCYGTSIRSSTGGIRLGDIHHQRSRGGDGDRIRNRTSILVCHNNRIVSRAQVGSGLCAASGRTPGISKRTGSRQVRRNYPVAAPATGYIA